MIVNSEDRVDRLIADGVESVFNFTFQIGSVNPSFPQDDGQKLRVYVIEDGIEIEQIEGADYTITTRNPDGTGSITFVTPPLQGSTVVLTLSVPVIQPVKISDAPQVYTPKVFEGLADYSQQTNLTQENRFSCIPAIHPAHSNVDGRNVFSTKDKADYVPGINETEDGWRLLSPSEQGPLIPPDPNDPDSYNRALYIAEQVGKRVRIAVMPLTYFPSDPMISSLVDLWVNGKLRLIQNGRNHDVTFDDQMGDIHFDLYTQEIMVDNEWLVEVREPVRFGENYTFKSAKKDVRILDSSTIVVGTILMSGGISKPYLLIASPLYDTGTVVECSRPFQVTDRLIFSGIVDTHTVQFSQVNGDYDVIFDIDPAADAGDKVLTASIVGTTITVKAAAAPPGVPTYPSGTQGAHPYVGNVIGNNPVLEDSAIQQYPDSGENITRHTGLVEYRTLEDVTKFVKMTFSENTPADFFYNITSGGFVRVVLGANGLEFDTSNANPNGVDYPNATVGAHGRVLSGNGSDTVLEDSPISSIGSTVTVGGVLFADVLRLLSTTAGALTLTPNTAGEGNVDINLSILGDGENRITSMSRLGNQYQITTTDIDPDDLLGGTIPENVVPKGTDTGNSLQASAITDNGIVTAISNDLIVLGETTVTDKLQIDDGLNVNEITFTAQPQATKVNFNLTAGGSGIAYLTNIAGGDFEMSVSSFTPGTGNMTQNDAINNRLVKVQNAGSNLYTNSGISDDGTNVNIETTFSIQGNGIAFGNPNNLIFELRPTGGGGVLTATIIGNTVTISDIDIPTGIGDVTCNTPVLHRFQIIVNAATKEIGAAPLSHDPSTNLTISLGDFEFQGEIIAALVTGLAEAGLVGLEDLGGGKYKFVRVDNPLIYLYPQGSPRYIPKVNAAGDKFEDSGLYDDGNEIVSDLPFKTDEFYITDKQVSTDTSIAFGQLGEGVLYSAPTGVDETDVIHKQLFENVGTISVGAFTYIKEVDIDNFATLTPSALTEDTNEIVSQKPLISTNYTGINFGDVTHKLYITNSDAIDIFLNFVKTGFVVAEYTGNNVTLRAADADDLEGIIGLELLKFEGDEPDTSPLNGQVPVMADAENKIMRPSPVTVGSNELIISETVNIDVRNRPFSYKMIMRGQFSQGILHLQDAGQYVYETYNLDALTEKRYIIETAYNPATAPESGVVGYTKTFEGGVNKITLNLKADTGGDAQSNTDFSTQGPQLEEGALVTFFDDYRAVQYTCKQDPIALVKGDSFTRFEAERIKANSVALKVSDADDVATIDIDLLDTSPVQRIELNGDKTITFTNTALSQNTCVYKILELSATGIQSTITWGNTILWKEGIELDGSSFSILPDGTMTLAFEFMDFGGVETIYAWRSEPLGISDESRRSYFIGDVEPNKAVVFTEISYIQKGAERATFDTPSEISGLDFGQVRYNKPIRFGQALQITGDATISNDSHYLLEMSGDVTLTAGANLPADVETTITIYVKQMTDGNTLTFNGFKVGKDDVISNGQVTDDINLYTVYCSGDGYMLTGNNYVRPSPAKYKGGKNG